VLRSEGIATPMLGRQQAMRFAGAVFGDYGKDDFAGVKVFEARGAGNELCSWAGRWKRRAPGFCAAIPASRRASSNEVRRSRCLPTPLVRRSLGDHVLAQFICLQRFARVRENANLT